LFVLFNVPSSVTQSEIELIIQEVKIVRIYKKCFVWNIVIKSSEILILEEKLKKVNFGQVILLIFKENLKYESNQMDKLKKQVLKRIHYNKDSSDLKASHEKNSHASNQESTSWRKKSGEASNEEYCI
jgi:hypothetical protein